MAPGGVVEPNLARVDETRAATKGDEEVGDATPEPGRPQAERAPPSTNDWSFDVAADFAIDIISLAEALFTTLMFDEDQYGFVYIALVFTLAPVLDSTFKLLAFCTRTQWDDFVVDLISEGVQAFLYIYFCNFSAASKIWIPAFMSAQIVIIVLMKLKQMRSGEKPEISPETKAMRCTFCCTGSCVVIMNGIFVFPVLFMQDEAPFRQKYFELIVAVVNWIFELNLKHAFGAMERVLAGDFLDEIGEEFTDEAKQKLKEYLRDPRTLHGKIAIAKDMSIVLNILLIWVLAWVWRFSPDIIGTYDIVVTTANMVLSCIAMSAIFCGCVYIIFQSKETTSSRAITDAARTSDETEFRDDDEQRPSNNNADASSNALSDAEKLIPLRNVLIAIKGELERKRGEIANAAELEEKKRETSVIATTDVEGASNQGIETIMTPRSITSV